jgi:hypothetical protein
MHVSKRRHATSSTLISDLVFWLVVMAVVVGVAALMWSTATGGIGSF